MERYLRFPGGKAKALTLSYDDGVIYDERLIEIMKKNGVKGTFNINSGLTGIPRRFTKEQCIELYSNSGMEVAIHGYKHLWPDAIHGATIYKEFATDKENLEEWFGGIIRGMAYAQGRYTDEVVDVLKTLDVAYSRTVESTFNFKLPTDWLRLKPTCHHKYEKLPELVKAFNDANPNKQNNKHPMLFYLWGHSYEFEDNNNWEIIEDFCQSVGGREDVWYATNIEIYDYVKAYENLHFSANEKVVRNDSPIDIYFWSKGTTYVAKASTITELF